MAQHTRIQLMQALLDDNENLACAFKIILDRQLHPELLYLELGLPNGQTGWGFTSLDFLLRNPPDPGRQYPMEVAYYELGPGWYVNDFSEDVEIGPLGGEADARDTALGILNDRGLKVLKNMPG